MAEFPADLHAEIEKYERKHVENPDGRYFLPLANTYRKLGQLERAEELLRAGLKRHPDYLSAHIVLGRTLADRGAAAEATAEFQHVLAVDPQNLIALRTLGELAVGEDRLEDAGHWYRELLAVDPMNDEARQALADIEAASAADEIAGAAEQGAAQPKGEEFDATHTDRVATAAAAVEDVREAVETEHIPDDEGADGEERVLPAWVESIDPFLGDRDAEAAEDLLPMLEPTGADEEPRPGAEWSSGEPTGEAGDFEVVAPDVAEGADLAEVDAFSEPPTDPRDAEPWDAALADEPEDLASETLAELYARQGFTQQAADMYRQLIRRRGAEPALLLRLAELEAEESGAGRGGQPSGEGTTIYEGAVERESEVTEPLESELAPAQAELQPGIEDAAFEESPSEGVVGPGERAREQDLKSEEELAFELEEEAVEELAGRWNGADGGAEPGDLADEEVEEAEVVFEEPARVGDAMEDFPTAGSELDLAEAWEEVFPEEDAASVEDTANTAAAVELLSVEPRAEATPFAESFRFGFAGGVEPEPVLDAEVSYAAAATDGTADAEAAAQFMEQRAEAAPAVPTISEYFSALLAWAPARQESSEAPVDMPDAGAAPPAAESVATTLEPSEAGSDAEQAAEASAEQELFPWELPGSPESGPSSSGREEEEAPPHRADTLREADGETSFGAVEDTSVERDSHLEQREEPSPFASPDAEEDDDLESFQAWLRSLKR